MDGKIAVPPFKRAWSLGATGLLSTGDLFLGGTILSRDGELRLAE